MKNQEKTARALRIAAVCLIAVLVAVLGVSAAYARYTYHASGKDQARVAKLNVVVTEGSGGVEWHVPANKVTEGGPRSYTAWASYHKSFTVTNASEVVVRSTAHVTGVPARGCVRITIKDQNDQILIVTSQGGEQIVYNDYKIDNGANETMSVALDLGQLNIGQVLTCALVLETDHSALVGVGGNAMASVKKTNDSYRQNVQASFYVSSVQVD